MSDRDILKKLTNHFSGDRNLVQTDLALILPIGASGYAMDESGRVVGLKIGFMPKELSPVVLATIAQLKHLKRFVFMFNQFDEFPLAILPSLEFIYIGGVIRTLPAELFEKNLPIFRGMPDEIPNEVDPFLGGVLRSEVWRELRRATSRLPLEEHEGGSKRGEGEAEEASLQSLLSARSSLRDELLVLRGLVVDSQDLEDPPLEIVAKGRVAVREYLFGRDAGSELLNEVKVILVGGGGSGKTSLMKGLLREEFNPSEDQTHGINIRRWSPASERRGLTVNLWDFGGQEIMHATHQFFLSKRSFYILVLDGRKEEDAEYWLQHIQSFGGESPIIVALNKVDQNPSFDVNRRFLQAKYQGIVGFVRLSCATRVGVEELRGFLLGQLSKVTILQTRWPKAWFRVKNRLENLGSDYISLEQYKEICADEGVVELSGQETLVDFLHDLGVVLHFRDIELLDTHVLDPQWVTEAVYRIINSETLAQQRGVLQLRQIGAVLWSEGAEFLYSPDKHQYIVSLMLKFELCYKLDGGAILVPDLLDIQEPPLQFDYAGALRFVFEYSYLPKSIMARFIVRMHGDIKLGLRWRTGVVLEDIHLGSTALVLADEKAKRIYVHVSGKQKRDYFAVIRKVVGSINESFEKLHVLELVPIPDVPEVLLDYRELVGHELAEREEIFVGRLGRAYSVKLLLSGIEAESSRKSNPPILIAVTSDYVNGQEGIRISEAPRNMPDHKGDSMTYQAKDWEKVVVYVTGLVFVGSVVFLAIRNQPIADPNIVVFLRVLLSIVVAVLGAIVPGMLKVDLSVRGLGIRAVGALALFIITFLLTPEVISVEKQ